MGEEKVCTACMFCKKEDFGYSNYTVEGTNLSCLWELMAEEEKYLDDDQSKRLHTIAEQCKFYREGTGIYSDCDGEEKDANIAEWIAIHIKPQT